MDLRLYHKALDDPKNRTLLQKALLSTDSSSAEALLPENLENAITNTVIELVPELELVDPHGIAGKVHEFNKLLSIPGAGSAMGEAAVTPSRSSSFARDTVQLKILRRKGAVTGFLQDTSRDYINAQDAELQAHLQSFGYDLRTYLVHGNAGADPYTFSGLDTFIATNRTVLAAAGVVPTNFEHLDTMLDESNSLNGKNHGRVFLISPGLLSKYSRLMTTIRDTADFKASGKDYFMRPGGQKMTHYNGVPFFETTALQIKTKMGTVTPSSAGSGSIPDDTYYFRVAAVTWKGEQEASDEVNTTTSSAATVTLSFAAVENALYYKVYCGLATGTANTPLVKVVPASTYDGSGTITGSVTSVTFTSNPSTPDATSAPVHMQGDLPYVNNGNSVPETLILWDLDKFQGLGKVVYTNTGASEMKSLITYNDLAITDDNTPFLLKSYSAMVPSFEKTSYMVRGLCVS